MRKIVILILFLFGITSSETLLAQRISFPFSGAYDEDAVLRIGIQYSYVNARYILNLNENWSTTGIDYGPTNNNTLPNLQSIRSQASHGMSVGLPIDVRITDNLYSTFSPNFVFINNSSITFTGVDPEIGFIDKRMRHTTESRDGSNFNSFEFPLSLKLRSDEKVLKNKFNRYRAYLTGGTKYTRFVGLSQEYNEIALEPEQANPLLIKPGYLSWEAGVGVEIFFTYFKVSPEIKFSQSFGNVLDKNHALNTDNQFMEKLDKAFVRNIQFSLIFQ
ncbi:PorT [Sphingobacterium hungaricum]|uniref:PorT n=1 Tax=Sphingobacterium hungaricum TaxID=2082723 RepID=UPI001E3EEBED|nr:PorT [Sphingobacterium hungaricum]